MQGDADFPTGWTVQQHHQAAVALHQQGKFEEAEAHYRAVLRLLRDHPGTLHNVALLLIQTGRLDEAAATYKKIIGGSSHDAAAHAGLGQVLHALKRDEEALAQLRRAVLLKPDFAEAHANLGNVLAALNRPDDALASYARALALNSGLVEVHNNMGTVLASLGRQEQAVTAFEKALARRPGFLPAMIHLGNALSDLGRYPQAIAWFERALSIQPNDAALENSLGMALAALNRHEDAVAHYRKALAEQPDSPAALNNLGNSLDALVRPAEALAVFEKLAALEPNNAAAHFGAGTALRILGKLDDARRCYERAVALAPSAAAYHRVLAEAKRVREDDPQLAVMEDLAQRSASLSANDQVELHFALAKAYSDMGRHGPAFDHLASGNGLKRQLISYDEAAQLGGLRAIADVFTSEVIAARQDWGDPSTLPVFIVGMPRSGTTLIEQVLASHPQVFGAGELLVMPDLISAGRAGAGFPFEFAALSGERLRALGAEYVARLRLLAPEADRITDKLPANFSLIGLIQLALPKARIIHVQRDPLDTCYSCYANLFSQGMEFTYDLGELGRHYRAYERLMAHWRAVLPAGAMFDVRYEDMVADFEAQARRIVAYCGLPWDSRCLSFYQTERAVRTASAGQVRRPVYASSVGRWRPYQDQLGPLFAALTSS